MYENHICPSCGTTVSILCDGRELKSYEWCSECKEKHKQKDWAVRWFNHRFNLFIKKDIYMRDGYSCYICKKLLGLVSRETTLDHQIPLSRGGLSTLSNMRMCCNDCNNKKGDLLLEEFFELFPEYLP